MHIYLLSSLKVMSKIFVNAQQVVFEAVRGLDYQGDISIDDVKLGTGACRKNPRKNLYMSLHVQKADD